MNKVIDNLSRLLERGDLSEIDLEFCRTLQQLVPDIDDDVLLVAAMVSYAYRQGDVCLTLDNGLRSPILDLTDLKKPDLDPWIARIEASEAVGRPGEYKPLILDDYGRLYLQKLWQYEQQLGNQIFARTDKKSIYEGTDSQVVKTLDKNIKHLFGDLESDAKWQAIAAVSCLMHKFTVISGGPGTGKTTTVVKILALLLEQARTKGESVSVALAAPTGKAASRLENSVNTLKAELQLDASLKSELPDEAVTVHQLLGARRHTARFRFNENNPLPYDVVIIDEASMIDQVLMSRLMSAMLDSAKVILLGDKDQLASVEAGSVLGDICNLTESRISVEFANILEGMDIVVEDKEQTKDRMPLTDQIILLEKNYRFDKQSGIFELAQKVNKGLAEEALTVLQDPEFSGVTFRDIGTGSVLERELNQIIDKYIRPSFDIQDPEQLFENYRTFQLLSAHRRGPLGIEHLNHRIETLIKEDLQISKYDKWYHGKPIIINRNDYTLGLNNGDIGICLAEEHDLITVCFLDDGKIKKIPPARLPEYQSAYALTVHKSQGSEFEQIYFMLPPKESPVLTRELIYTALTRARNDVIIAGKEEVLLQGIKEKIRRTSGLQDLLWN